MDDPWANAWGEPAKPAINPQNTWVSPANPVLDAQDAEADLAMPSWATGAGVHWAEPSEDQATLWHPTSPTKEWITSPYDNISLGKASQDELSQVDDRTTSPEPDETTTSSSSSSPAAAHQSLGSTILDDIATNSNARSPTPTLASTPEPGSPDGFGTFETGLDVDEADVDPWSRSIVSPPSESPETSVWVPSWGTPDMEVAAQTEDKRVDEWETAKLRKERQDKHVPPQVLASILSDFRELPEDLWPNVPTTSEESLGGVEDFRSDRYRGLDGVEGLAAVEQRIVPQDLTLPKFVKFSKTFTAKHMAEALRLTRHVPITRASPFALYLASKGSTAWETSVKSRVEVASDDVLPPGWRVVEKSKEETTAAVDAKKKTTGGLLSFFGRKGPIHPLQTPSRRSASPVQRPTTPTATAAASPVATSSARTSVDSVKSLPKPTTSAVVSSIGSSSAGHVSTPDPGLTSPSDVFEPAQASSAVSRFLNRFSRTKSAGSSPRNSLALSTDDIEFLSDIVPSANDDIDEASQLKELSNMIGSSPLSTALPPPLAPPPRPPPIRATSIVGSTPEPRPPAQSTNNNDLLSLFDSPPKPTVLPIHSTSFTPTEFFSSSAAMESPISPPTPTFPQKIEPQRTGSSASSRGVGPSFAAFDFPPPPTSRAHTPLQPKRAPVAIMSTGSSSTSLGSIFALPPPPMLPPPPNSKASTSELIPTSRPPSRPAPVKPIHEHLVDDEFSDFYSPPQPKPSGSFDTSVSSIFSDQSLFSTPSSVSIPESSQSFDDFDDFVSSPLRTPSPPRPPAKQTVLPLKPPQQQRSQLPLLPPIKHPSAAPRRTSRAADHQRTLSLVVDAAARPGRWPAPPSPLPEALPPPAAPPPPSINGSLLNSGSSMQTQQTKLMVKLNSSASSPAAFPPPMPRPFPPVPATTMAPSPPPTLRALSPPNRISQNGSAKPSALATLTPSSVPPPVAASGGLSEQDLSFFEGL
ncbi:hypothetical protein Hypma_009042 [Hypsizygus marmoreus]|uniref:Uncharacterized protein n=1 Tax=Hypsizygus marmoreus TaxID=39966 RepID=A0A369JNU2_HYPMA|nr:hypothetical protein Hypma_009042 [Hypsizygus marmoreus]